MLKKAGFVAATAAGLTMLGGTAFAADDPGNVPAPNGDQVTFSDAYQTFVEGGGAAGYGAASLVAGAYTGIITSASPFANSIS